MENPFNSSATPRVAPGTFMRGFINGAGSGALMMGIFYTAMLVAGAVSLGTIGLPFAVGILSTGLFSGIMASKRAHEDLRSAANVSAEAERAPSRQPLRAPEQANTPEQTIEETRERQKKWTSTVNKSEGSISEILANGALSDKDRASAILAAREQLAPGEVAR